MKKLLSFIFMLSVSLVANSQTLGTMADSVADTQIPAVLEMFSMFAYISGIALTVKAILKFKEVSESKGQVKLKTPIFYLVAGAGLLMLPYLIGLGIQGLGLNKVDQGSQRNFSVRPTLNGNNY